MPTKMDQARVLFIWRMADAGRINPQYLSLSWHKWLSNRIKNYSDKTDSHDILSAVTSIAFCLPQPNDNNGFIFWWRRRRKNESFYLLSSESIQNAYTFGVCERKRTTVVQSESFNIFCIHHFLKFYIPFYSFNRICMYL